MRYLPPPWFAAPVAARLREQALALESEAYRLREVANKVESPPEGVTVEYDGRDTLKFVGQIVTAHSHPGTGE